MDRVIAVAIAGMILVGGVAAQPAHRAVTIAAVQADPSAFHGQLVQVTGTVTRQGDRILVSNSSGALRLLAGDPVPDGDVEVRGMVLDIGRIDRDDPRLAAFNARSIFEKQYQERWPKPGEEIVVAVRSVRRQSREVAAIAIAPVPPLPLDVDFSVPVEGEADVRLDARIRLQFSRDVDARSLKDRIRMTYSRTDSVERGEAHSPALTVTFRYNAGSRALEITPTQPLERFRQVSLALLDGIVGTDGSVLRPWTLSFTTGGS